MNKADTRIICAPISRSDARGFAGQLLGRVSQKAPWEGKHFNSPLAPYRRAICRYSRLSSLFNSRLSYSNTTRRPKFAS